MTNELAAALSIFQVAGLALVARGFWPMLQNSTDRRVYHMSWGVTMMVIAISFRSAYWDILPVLCGGFWPAGGPFGRAAPNLVFGTMVLISLYHKLSLLREMIPENERGRYSLLSAPFYPKHICVIRLAAALRDAWRK
ncbi:hypothetical protein DL1_19615 [Thioclava dalianensis]|uniref:Uncharacterized protein n=1 Tax=Thioclava dalianensis TaxID=1185766 RepID=A0A074TFN0_9RHOB|nr:hypothetical protein [Thioclava dalianensis]KEP67813.1 hypothetical protein DL1_19615 [Thioclava dalianensis]SFN48777.1 hypothetical protein SAMN05216224_10636 [Thioclava dalianensis]